VGLNSHHAHREFELDAAARRVLAGDSVAFRLLVDGTAVQLYRLAARLMGDTQEAEDVLQESYCRAFEALTCGRFDARSSLMTWLYRIVTNSALDALRSRKRNKTPRERSEPANVVSLPVVDGRLALRELSEWLADLRPAQRTAALRARRGDD
jgi:RNA polymerase sigma-70 factor (ECF subfamily)